MAHFGSIRFLSRFAPLLPLASVLWLGCSASESGTSPLSASDTGLATEAADSGAAEALDDGSVQTSDAMGGSDTGNAANDAMAEAEAESVDASPKACAALSNAIDPKATDASTTGPLNVGHSTFTVPNLGPLVNVKVRITYPAKADGITPDPGKHAWVMFHHAVHCDTTPCTGVVYDEYDGIFDYWASHGFVVLSVDGAKIFFPTPKGSFLGWDQQQTVAKVMSEAITYFLSEQEKADFPLRCLLDPNRVAVSGHSRGGGGALLVPTTRTDAAKIKAYVGFQPVDPEITQGAPLPATVPGFDLPALWLDSALDGDVSYPIIAMQYSHTRASASHVTILGSKHTYTLDKPLPSQGGTPATITPDEHKAVCNFYAVSFLRARLRDESPDPTDLDRIAGPSGMSVPAAVSSGNVTLRWRPVNSSVYLERFEEALGTTPLKTEGGDAITLEGGMTAVSYETFLTSVPPTGAPEWVAVDKLIRAVKLNWGATEAAMNLPLPAGALVGKKAIVFETAWLNSPGVASGDHPMFLELVDSTGAKSSVAIKDAVGTTFTLRPRRPAAAYAPLAKFTGIDLSKAKTLRLVAKAGAAPKADILVGLLRVE
ncbi:MAG: hypothetical protein NVSMB1_01600 [Polyangiales bacterium]